MFVINPNRLLNLKEYGILIPLLDKRFIECTNWVHNNIDKSYIHILEEPMPLTRGELELCHDSEFINNLFDNPEKEIVRTFELIDELGNYYRYDPNIATRPLTELVDRISSHIRGSLLTTELALKHDFAFFMGGGLHHSMTFGGRGFCLINDIVLSLRILQQQKRINTAWVIDVDVHKGDGTAEITKDDDSIITFSIHMKKGWPLVTPEFDPKGNQYPWYIPSNIDVEMEVGQESQYLKHLEDSLNQLKNQYPLPDLVIINLGSDPYEKDELDSSQMINLTLEQMKQRDRLIYDFFKQHNIPQAYLMSGGYGDYAHEPYMEFFSYLNEQGTFQ
jgi:acetoin utilization deacetylase AcuC-like enzyme